MFRGSPLGGQLTPTQVQWFRPTPGGGRKHAVSSQLRRRRTNYFGHLRCKEKLGRPEAEALVLATADVPPFEGVVVPEKPLKTERVYEGDCL